MSFRPLFGPNMASKKHLKDAFGEDEDKTAFEHSLINLVEPVRFIWDPKDANYKNKMKRQNAFTTMSSSLGKKAEVCAALWDFLRSQFLAYKRKLPSGSGADAIPSFRYFSQMQFLSDGQHHSKTICSINEDDSEKQDIVEIEIVSEPSSASEVLAEFEINETDRKASGSIKSHQKYNGKRKQDPVDEEMLRYLKTINTPKADDEFDAFGKVMASKLRPMSELDKKVAAECELNVHKVMCEAEIRLLEQHDA